MDSWNDYEKAAISFAMKFILAVFGLGLFIIPLSYTCGVAHNAAVTAQHEFQPSAMLTKYEWFKEAAAQLEKKRADVDVYQARIEGMKLAYEDTPRARWPREDREQLNVWASEVAGVKASYNQLAAEYNAKMAEFNWRFANVGQLPQGATEPLPREFKPYLEK